MTSSNAWRYRAARLAGRVVTRTCAALTLGNMPPFVSTSAIVLDGDRILCVCDPIRTELVLPGGHLKWAESPQSGLVREVFEETNYRVEPRNFVGVYSGEDLCSEKGIVRVVYTARVVGGVIGSSHEGEAAWIPVSEFLESARRDGPIVEQWLVTQEVG